MYISTHSVPTKQRRSRTRRRRLSVPPASLKEKLVSAALWGRGLTWLLPWTSAMIGLNRTVGPDRIQSVNRAFCTGQLKSVATEWNAVVHPEVKDDEQYIFAQNHVNHLDFVTMHNATPHFKQGVELETHFRYPFYGWFMKSRGTISVPTDRMRRTRSVKRQIKAEVAQNHSILVFPEGTRTNDGSVRKFRAGVFFMARDLGLKVVPTAVTGMFEVMRKGSLVLRPGKVTVYCDAPVDFAGLSDEQIHQQIAVVRNRIKGRVDAHRAQTRAQAVAESGS